MFVLSPGLLRLALRLFLSGLLFGAAGCFGALRQFVPKSAAGFRLGQVTSSVGTRAYYQHVPLDPAPPTGWPVLLFLHGGGESGQDPRRPTQVGLGPVVFAAGGHFPFVVLFPQSERRSAWTSRRSQAHAMAVLDDALGRLPVDASRVYVIGNSMGGHGALHLAARHPGRFAALVAVAGRAGRNHWLPAPPDSVEELPEDDPYGALAEQLREVPTWLFHGDEDGVTFADESRRLFTALHALGSEVRLTIYPGAGHAGAWERAYREPALFDWLIEHRLPHRR